MNIAIIGAGELGQAIATALKVAKQDAQLWDKDESIVKDQLPFEEVVQQANLVFLCIPSWAMRDALKDVKKHIQKEAIIILCAKGIEQKTKKTMDEVIEEEIPGQPFALISGPMLAEEIEKKKYGYGVVATKDISTYSEIAKVFEKTPIITSFSTDIRGIAFCGVLKNVYALGLGIIEGLKLGSNTLGALVNQAGTELLEMIATLEGDPESVMSYAGIGDLIATGFSSYSHNRTVGKEIGSKQTCCDKSEGSVSIESVGSLIGDTSDFPFFHAIYESVKEPKSVKKEFETLITRHLAH